MEYRTSPFFFGRPSVSRVGVAFFIFLAFFSRFLSRFGYQHVGIKNAREKREKNKNASESTHSVIRP